MYSNFHRDRKGEKHLKLEAENYTVKKPKSKNIIRSKLFRKNNLNYGK